MHCCNVNELNDDIWNERFQNALRGISKHFAIPNSNKNDYNQLIHWKGQMISLDPRECPMYEKNPDTCETNGANTFDRLSGTCASVSMTDWHTCLTDLIPFGAFSWIHEIQTIEKRLETWKFVVQCICAFARLCVIFAVYMFSFFLVFCNYYAHNWLIDYLLQYCFWCHRLRFAAFPSSPSPCNNNNNNNQNFGALNLYCALRVRNATAKLP